MLDTEGVVERVRCWTMLISRDDDVARVEKGAKEHTSQTTRKLTFRIKYNWP